MQYPEYGRASILLYSPLGLSARNFVLLLLLPVPPKYTVVVVIMSIIASRIIDLVLDGWPDRSRRRDPSQANPSHGLCSKYNTARSFSICSEQQQRRQSKQPTRIVDPWWGGGCMLRMYWICWQRQRCRETGTNNDNGSIRPEPNSTLCQNNINSNGGRERRTDVVPSFLECEIVLLSISHVPGWTQYEDYCNGPALFGFGSSSYTVTHISHRRGQGPRESPDPKSGLKVIFIFASASSIIHLVSIRRGCCCWDGWLVIVADNWNSRWPPHSTQCEWCCRAGEREREQDGAEPATITLFLGAT